MDIGLCFSRLLTVQILLVPSSTIVSEDLLFPSEEHPLAGLAWLGVCSAHPREYFEDKKQTPCSQSLALGWWDGRQGPNVGDRFSLGGMEILLDYGFH